MKNTKTPEPSSSTVEVQPRSCKGSFIETSLLVNLGHCSSDFEKRAKGALLQPQFTSSYVKMEYRRAVLLRMAQFCIQLHLPETRTADDLFARWQNHYLDRASKIALSLSRQLTGTGLDTRTPGGKPAVFRALVSYMLRLETKLVRSTNTTPESGLNCARAKPHLLSSKTRPDDLLDVLLTFANELEDVAHCRSRCKIDRFITKHRSDLEHWISESDANRIKGDPKRGMTALITKGKKLLEDGAEKTTCHNCAGIGDMVVALDAPRDLRLEHVDHVFDYMCAELGTDSQKHRPDL